MVNTDLILKPYEEIENETYHFLGVNFELTDFYEFITDYPREPQGAPVEVLSGGLALIKVDDEPVYRSWDEVMEMDGEKTIRPGTAVDWEYVREMPEANLEIPIWIVTYNIEASESNGFFLIDGNQRLARALIEEREEIPAYVLTPEETGEVYPEQISMFKD